MQGQASEKQQGTSVQNAAEWSSGEDIEEGKLAAMREAFLDAMNSDLNTSSALTVLYDVLKADADSATKLAAIREFDTVLSLGLLEAAQAVKKSRAAKSADAAADADGELAAWVEQKIEERRAAKKNKDFAAADAIREELAARGVVIRDTREGTVWELA
ncbi:MAG: cysteine--tRNA ligase, partial [Lachnospiraceae bacterium]|nr:cysteine--tRNA ligase [Lachnospiraceae bacterium]